MNEKLICMKRGLLFIPFLLVIVLLMCSFYHQPEKNNNIDINIQHGIVYYEDSIFSGWPANHGIWTWGDEILVGFVRARHMEKSGHTYDQKTSRDCYARSFNSGNCWKIEGAFDNGQKGWRYNNQLSDSLSVSPYALTESIDFLHPDFAITFQRETNNIGPSHFYYTYNRGMNWIGPFMISNMGTNGIATRTDYIIDDHRTLTAFFTVAKTNNREGRVLCVRTSDGGITWEKVAWVGNEPEGFDIMPSSVRLSSQRLLTVIRSRNENGQDFISAYKSDDNGQSWIRIKDPVADTGRGGSPPALLKLTDGRLALAYIYRSKFGSRVNVRFSIDEGTNWSDEIILRCCDGANTDVGYPKMIQRQDGKLLIVYYWNNSGLPNALPYRYIAYTMFDPTDINLN